MRTGLQLLAAGGVPATGLKSLMSEIRGGSPRQTNQLVPKSITVERWQSSSEGRAYLGSVPGLTLLIPVTSISDHE